MANGTNIKGGVQGVSLADQPEAHEAMTAFDKLPSVLRDFLNYAPVETTPLGIERALAVMPPEVVASHGLRHLAQQLPLMTAASYGIAHPGARKCDLPALMRHRQAVRRVR